MDKSLPQASLKSPSIFKFTILLSSSDSLSRRLSSSRFELVLLFVIHLMIFMSSAYSTSHGVLFISSFAFMDVQCEQVGAEHTALGVSGIQQH